MDGSAVNVRVAVRCRPLSSKEITRGCLSIVQVDHNNILISGPTGKIDWEIQTLLFTLLFIMFIPDVHSDPYFVSCIGFRYGYTIIEYNF